MIKICKENPRDYSSIKELNDHAFGQTQESELIDKLRRNGGKLLSLVAVDDEKRSDSRKLPYTTLSANGTMSRKKLL